MAARYPFLTRSQLANSRLTGRTGGGSFGTTAPPALNLQSQQPPSYQDFIESGAGSYLDYQQLYNQAWKDYQMGLDPALTNMTSAMIPGSVQMDMGMTGRQTPAQPGTYQFQSPTLGAISPTLEAARAKADELFRRTDLNEQEQTWIWQDWYKNLVGSSLGLGKFSGAPLDPLAQLQQQLQEQYDPGYLNNLTGQQDFSSLLRQRNQALETQLQQRAAGMGVQGAYAGVIGQQEKARQALSARAQAAYNPMALQMQKQMQTQTDQLLNAINQAELESERLYATSGV